MFGSPYPVKMRNEVLIHDILSFEVLDDNVCSSLVSVI